MNSSEKDILWRTLGKEISLQFSLPSRDMISYEQIIDTLAGCIRPLLDKDFTQLINILYRVDVPEKKVADRIHLHPDKDAALLIADLILERTLQKIQSRQQFSNRSTNIPEEDKW